MAEISSQHSTKTEGIRKRMTNKEKTDSQVADNEEKLKYPIIYRGLSLQPGTYWLTRILLLRSLSFVFVTAFLVALHQNRALIGKNGLLPADQYLREAKTHLQDNTWDRFQHVPTVLWFFDYEQNINILLDILAYCGLALSAFVFVNGGASMILMLTIWIIYHSIVNVGQRWYSFGWESQILETCFLAVFLCPLLSVKKIPRHTPTSFISILGFRWLIFRIMIGAGLIKIRGDQCWRDLTCMNYHYETQPVPNPIAYLLHQSPEPLHKFETLGNHFIELVVPFFLLLNRRMRLIGGFLQVLFQVILIISGNLSFLNWLTIIPALACFDDKSISWMFSNKRGCAKWQVYEIQQDERSGKAPKLTKSNYIRRVMNLAFGALIAYLSIPIVQNLVSSRQIMNTSFDPLRIVNTYGAFGRIRYAEYFNLDSLTIFICLIAMQCRKAFNICFGLFVLYRSIPVVENTIAWSHKQKMNHYFEPFRMINSYGKFGSITKERTEVIFQGTYASNPNDHNAKWEEYEFNCKPGSVDRRPCLISPYHYRLDWLMWFAAFQNYQYNNWLVHLAAKFLVNDEEVTSLIAHNPFEGKDPPRFVRAEHYRYVYTKVGSKLSKEGKWWKRTKIGEYLPIVNLESLQTYMQQMGWKTSRRKMKKSV